jgi:RNA polymerase primary sigma factor
MRQLKISKSITNRESAALTQYLQDIAHIDMISAEEEVQLAQRIKLGDKDALHKLTNANLRFVVSVAKQYQNHGMPLIDLINEGNLGLIKAAERFDETRGFKFISYAVWWIRQSILQALSEKSRIVHMPGSKVTLNNKISLTAQHLEQKYEREPTAMEIAEIMEMSVEEIEQAMTSQMKHTSLDAPVGSEEFDVCLGDLMTDSEDPNAEQILSRGESLKQELDRVLASLPTRQQQIVKLYYGLETSQPTSLEEIGSIFELTRERVRQIKDKAMAKLRDTQHRSLLIDFLGY